jgi:hypothetical protein
MSSKTTQLTKQKIMLKATIFALLIVAATLLILVAIIKIKFQ